MNTRMNRRSLIWKALGLVVAFAIPTLTTMSNATAKTTKTDEAAAGSDKAASKEEQAKLKDHNKLRAEINRVKYPATKAEVVSHVKGVKADDKKWFEETLPERTYASSDEVALALGWEASPPVADAKPAARAKKPATSGASGNGEKSTK